MKNTSTVEEVFNQYKSDLSIQGQTLTIRDMTFHDLESARQAIFKTASLALLSLEHYGNGDFKNNCIREVAILLDFGGKIDLWGDMDLMDEMVKHDIKQAS